MDIRAWIVDRPLTVDYGRAGNVQWQPESTQPVRVRARQEFTDDIEDLVVRMSDPEEVLIPDLADSAATSPGVYRGRLAELDYRSQATAWCCACAQGTRASSLSISQNDRVEHGVFLSADYRLRPRLTVFLQGLEQKRKFLTRGTASTTTTSRAWRHLPDDRHLSWEAEVDRNVRDSTLSDPRYRENAVQFTIIWKR